MRLGTHGVINRIKFVKLKFKGKFKIKALYNIQSSSQTNMKLMKALT